MSSCEASPASEALRSTHARPLSKLIIMAAALFILAAGFFLASAHTATAAAAAASTNVHISPAPDLAAPSCGGQAPGFCPNPNFGFAN
jgi:hypothetical protein